MLSVEIAGFCLDCRQPATSHTKRCKRCAHRRYTAKYRKSDKGRRCRALEYQKKKDQRKLAREAILAAAEAEATKADAAQQLADQQPQE